MGAYRSHRIYTVAQFALVMTLPSLANADTACARLESLAAAWEQKAYQLGSMADRQNALGDRLSGNVNRNFAWGGAANKHAQSAELMNQSIAAREYVRAGNCEEYLSMLQQNQQEAARQTDVKNRAKQVLWSYYQQHNQIPPPIPGNVSAIAAQIGASPSDVTNHPPTATAGKGGIGRPWRPA